MYKKAISILLSLLIMASLAPQRFFTVYAGTAASGSCGDSLVWRLDTNGELTISGSGKMTEWNTSSPAPWLGVSESITSVSVGAGVESIGSNSFSSCKKLAEVSLGEGLLQIGTSAFTGCSSLEAIELPDSLTAIGAYAFAESGLTKVSVPEKVAKIEQNTFQNCTALSSVGLPDMLTAIGAYAFSGCTSLRGIDIPAKVSTIGIGAFSGSALESIAIPEGIISLSGKLFSGCASLRRVELPDSLGSIGTEAFNSCVSLSSVHIPSSVTAIDGHAFYRCTALEELSLPPSVSNIGTRAFEGCSSLVRVELGEGLLAIGSYAFSGCTSLEDIAIPEGVVSVGNHAFKGCTSLKRAILPDSLTSLKPSLFYLCSSLTEVILPKGLTTLPVNIFGQCSALTNIILPDSVRQISSSSFSGCTALRAVTIPAAVTLIDSDAFSGCQSLADIHYSGSSGQWAQITVRTGNDSLLRARQHCHAHSPAERWRFDQYAHYAACSCGQPIGQTHTFSEDICSVCGYVKYSLPTKPTTTTTTATTTAATITTTATTTSIAATTATTTTTTTTTASTAATTTTTTSSATTTTTTTTTGPAPVTPSDAAQRIAGTNRCQTAVEISKACFERADCVVLASGDNYADALAGVPLAYALNAPILLVRKAGLDEATAAEIERLGARMVYILGGDGAISSSVEEQLSDIGCTSSRIAGRSRFDTAAAIAVRLRDIAGAPETVFLADANNYPDALAISTIASILGCPVLYIGGEGVLSEATESFLRENSHDKVVILGGEIAISPAAEKNIEALGITSHQRIAGTSRYETCIAINRAYADILTGEAICAATGTSFPDALAGGVFAAVNKAPLLLVGDSLSELHTGYISETEPSRCFIFGGEQAVSAHAADQLREILS